MTSSPPRTFDEFAASELPALLSFATALTGSRDAAADVVQESLIRAALRWRRIGALEDPTAYVRRMVTHEWFGQRRRWFARRVTVTDDVAGAAPVGHDVADDFSAGSDLRADLRARLLTLPHRQRAVLVLRHYLGLDDAAIAVELGCALGTVRSLASRGAATLRLSYQGDGSADPHPGTPPRPPRGLLQT